VTRPVESLTPALPAPHRAPPPSINVAAWPVPSWLTKPLLSVPIPHSGFGFGCGPQPVAVRSRAVEAEAEFLGFGDELTAQLPEPLTSTPPTSAIRQIETVAPEPMVAPAAPVVETAEQQAVTEPTVPTWPAASEPVTAKLEPAGTPAIALTPSAPLEQPTPPETVEPEPAAASTEAAGPVLPAEVAVQAAPSPAPGKEADIAAAAMAIDEPSEKAAAPEPAVRDPVSVAASPTAAPTAEAPPRRAPRPLGAPQALPRPVPEPDAAEPSTAVTEVPTLVEPSTELARTAGEAPAVSDERALSRNRRLYRRVGLEADLEIDGIRAQLVDLSMDGFAGTAKWQYQSQAEVPVAIRMQIDGVHIGTELRSRIIYASELRTGGRFLNPTPSQTALLRYLVTWRGKPAGAIGTANLLDAIAGLPERSAVQQGAAVLELPGRSPPWWQRLFGRLLSLRKTARS
jgi:hypothetical protein